MSNESFMTDALDGRLVGQIRNRWPTYYVDSVDCNLDSASVEFADYASAECCMNRIILSGNADTVKLIEFDGFSRLRQLYRWVR